MVGPRVHEIAQKHLRRRRGTYPLGHAGAPVLASPVTTPRDLKIWAAFALNANDGSDARRLP